MTQAAPTLKAINSILNYKFYVPSYQRGYRWDKAQVIDLLSDIFEFIQKKEDKTQIVGEFYCLQPVIVKELNNEEFKVIDGQQRLTTIFIILNYLEKKSFSIEFQTRKKNESFLKNIDSDLCNDNIDFFHINKAYSAIKDWFEELEANEPTIKEEFFINLGKYTKFIWYEVNPDDDEIEVFTRINSGKIPLTNAELIKALFLNSKNFPTNESERRQIEIAKEWDEIEFSLQNNEFWHFLTKGSDYPTRIELIFEIIAGSSSKDKFATYRWFATKENVEELWADDCESVKKIFLTLKYWYDNYRLFHLIGFLVASGTASIKEIYHRFRGKTKKEFEAEILLTIKKEIPYQRLEELDYAQDHSSIFKVLLLFNIASVLKSSDCNVRFAFDRFNLDRWSLEHIHAQTDNGLLNTEAIKDWIHNVKKELENIDHEEKNSFFEAADALCSKSKISKVDTDFQEFQNKIFGMSLAV